MAIENVINALGKDRAKFLEQASHIAWEYVAKQMLEGDKLKTFQDAWDRITDELASDFAASTLAYQSKIKDIPYAPGPELARVAAKAREARSDAISMAWRKQHNALANLVFDLLYGE